MLTSSDIFTGRGIVFVRFLCFFVSNVTRKWLDRFAEIFREGVEWPWDDLITFWVNSGQRSICLLSPAIAQTTGFNKSVSFARWQQGAGFVVVPRTTACCENFSWLLTGQHVICFCLLEKTWTKWKCFRLRYLRMMLLLALEIHEGRARGLCVFTSRMYRRTAISCGVDNQLKMITILFYSIHPACTGEVCCCPREL